MKHSWQWEPELRWLINSKRARRLKTKKSRKIYTRILRRVAKRNLDFNPRMYKKRVNWEF